MSLSAEILQFLCIIKLSEFEYNPKYNMSITSTSFITNYLNICPFTNPL